MKRLLAFICLLACLSVPFSASAQTSGDSPPAGVLAQGTFQPTPGEQLVIGIVDGGVAGMGGTCVISGPPGFLMSTGEGTGFNVEGSRGTGYHVDKWGAVFLPGGEEYTLTNGEDWPAHFRYVAFGSGIKGDDKRGQIFYTGSLFWDVGTGALYDVRLVRQVFTPGSATSWQSRSGPTFGLLEGGVWEVRQSSGPTQRIATPGYYWQQEGKGYQLAQVGTGGYELSVWFTGAHDSKTAAGLPPSLAQPTALVETTPVPSLYNRVDGLPGQDVPPPDAQAATVLPTAMALPPPSVVIDRYDPAGWILGIGLLGVISLSLLWIVYVWRH